MRLFELINFDPVKTAQTVRSYSDKMRSTGNSSHIGSGSFGAAYKIDSGKRLNQVTKIGRAGQMDGARIKPAKSVKKDGYLSYLKAVQGKNNPYFPRIYDLKIMKNSNNELIYRANIEKLVGFASPKIYENDHLMASLYDDMFNEKNNWYHDLGPAAAIKFNLDHISSYHRISGIKDPELASALGLIYKVAKDGKFDLDMHPGNLMWRITGNRPQLVILDPIA